MEQSAYRITRIITNRLLVFAVLMVACFHAAAFALAPEPVDKDSWRVRNEQLNTIAQEGTVNGNAIDVLFIGDSITAGWGGAGKQVWKDSIAPFRAVQFGIGGDRTENVLWRLQNGNIDGKISPKVIVLLIGTNNTGHREQDPKETAADIKAIADTLQKRFPAAHIILNAVFPRSEKPDNKRKINDELNTLIAAYESDHVHYLNINDRLMKADGSLDKSIFPDYLHLSEKGYRIWAEALIPELSKYVMPSERVFPPLRVNEKDWKAKFESYNRMAQQGGMDILFIGDSITEFFQKKSGKEVWDEKIAPMNAANFGISGDGTQHVLWRLEHGNMDGKLSPRLIVIMLGTNNPKYGITDPAMTAADIKEILGKLSRRFPDAHMLLYGIFPRGEEKTDSYRTINEAVNGIISKYDSPKIHYVNINDRLMNADGSIDKTVMPDYLHPGEQGYVIWADSLLVEINKYLKQ